MTGVVKKKKLTHIEIDPKRKKMLWWFSNYDELYLVDAASDDDSPPSSLFGLPQISHTSVADQDYCAIGPCRGKTTAWATNALRILHRSGYSAHGIEKFRLVKPGKVFQMDNLVEQVYRIQELLLFFSKPAVAATTTTVATVNLQQLTPDDNPYGFDATDLRIYRQYFQDKLKRWPTEAELWDLSQSNSEHSRHWFFKGRLIYNNNNNYNSDNYEDETLMDLIQRPLKVVRNRSRSLVAFHDNASAIRGYETLDFLLDPNTLQKVLIHPTLTAETHNSPTAVHPFEGAATGIGGCLRDSLCIGRGGIEVAVSAGYCVGPLDALEKTAGEFHRPVDVLIGASNGASDYANKKGQPLVLGFARAFGNSNFRWKKPIMFTSTLGFVYDSNVHKLPPSPGQIIVRVGGPTYRLGLGGGSFSSRGQTTTDGDANQMAVQRGDPEMENKMARFVRACSRLLDRNPITSIHDQGAGGMANVTKEIVSPLGAVVLLRSVDIGDSTMTPSELWIAESQEQVTLLANKESQQLMESIAARENVPLRVVGWVTDQTGRVDVYDKDATAQLFPVSLDLSLQDQLPQKSYELGEAPPSHQYYSGRTTAASSSSSRRLYNPLNLEIYTEEVFGLVSVGSKRFLVNKADRSVTGLVAQQQTVGPLQTPVADYGLVASSHFSLHGVATAIGEQPLKGVYDCDVKKMARLSVGEMLTNLVFVRWSDMSHIRCSVNWMWPRTDPQENRRIHDAAEAISNLMIALGIAADGGKDSLSMYARNDDNKSITKSPGSVVITGYVTVPDIRCKVTPDLKQVGNRLIFIDLSSPDSYSLDGTALASLEYPNIQDGKCTDLRNPGAFKKCLLLVQDLLKRNIILSGHDRSDGGLLTTVTEMAMAGNHGCRLEFRSMSCLATPLEILFSEGLGLVIEVQPDRVDEVLEQFQWLAPAKVIGRVLEQKHLVIVDQNKILHTMSLCKLRRYWERTSSKLEEKQSSVVCAKSEFRWLTQSFTESPNYQFLTANTAKLLLSCKPQFTNNSNNDNYRVAILREEGSNGDREMAAAFKYAGFQVFDVTTTDLDQDDRLMDRFCGLALVGGFSFADVFGAATGWCAVIENNPRILSQFERFRQRSDTFSLGICNGCQLLAKLGWIEGAVSFHRNDSKRFESRFVHVRIPSKTKAIMLRDLAGSRLGVWVAHGEGKYESNGSCHNVALQYVDERGFPTINYPCNPNGSWQAVAGVCSPDGRHLAMMPHPERSFLNWQWAWQSPNIPVHPDQLSPWYLMFRAAYKWCGTINE
jgi:phosphoribosylformylglycinamidine synthase